MPHGKNYVDSAREIDRDKLYNPNEAIALVKSSAKRKFDESIDAAFRLGIDTKKADQMVRGTVDLPHGSGKSVRVAVFAAGPAAQEAKDAGADVVGTDDLVKQVENGFFEFDVAIATPDLMGQVGKLGRSLGPRGLMPNPKTGTVTNDVGKAVSEFKAGKVEYRADRYGNVHVRIGKASFEPNALVDNYFAVFEELNRAKPSATKGRYFKNIAVSSTMGPGVRLDPNATRES